MKSLISATLSVEAREVYDSWPRQQKSKIISEIIINQHNNMLLIEALRKNKIHLQAIIAKANTLLYAIDPQHPLCSELNDALEGTIHYQYRLQDLSLDD